MIKIENVSKYYKTFQAVKDMNLEIGRGEVFGFIGPNGAGKTTTIKMLATLMLPSEGKLSVGGYDIVSEPHEVRRLIGYMPDSFGVYEDLLAWEYLDYFAALYKLGPTQRKRAISDVLELTDLTIKRDAQVMSLSRGMKQRLCLAKTLLHDPAVLLLDEPASGLDPHARIEIRELIRELCRMGKTVLVSSHILTELADFCTSIGIIEAGSLLASGRIDDITAKLAGNVMLEITVKGDAALALDVLAERQEIKRVTCDGRVIHAEYGGHPDDVDDLLEYLVGRGVRLLGFTRTEADLEDIFLKITRGVVA
ncbi:MAG TPA: ABC transporter ATP-binding protein [Blastocatellia bacterium]|jgi:ABC-2 type transport system ATP-binding protein|nr:ABC transporter ATP-binding protein [Blastocatellia bacterium]